MSKEKWTAKPTIKDYLGIQAFLRARPSAIVVTIEKGSMEYAGIIVLQTGTESNEDVQKRANLAAAAPLMLTELEHAYFDIMRTNHIRTRIDLGFTASKIRDAIALATRQTPEEVEADFRQRIADAAQFEKEALADE